MNYLIYYVDESQRYKALDVYFKKEGHKTIHFNDIENLVTNLSEQKDNNKSNQTILIWHLTCSSFNKKPVKDDFEKAVQYAKDNTQYILDHKLGVSDNNNFYNLAKKERWFDFADSWNELHNLFKDGKGYFLAKGINNLPSYKIRKNVQNISYNFLSLDVEMQALQILWNDNKRKDAMKYLEEMLGDIENGFFLNKFSESEKYFKQIPGGDEKDNIKNKYSIGIDQKEDSYIYEFLALLDQKKKGGNHLTENDIQEVISYFKDNVGFFNSFHEWYREFDTLRF